MKSTTVTAIVTSYLLLYHFLFQFNGSLDLIISMFILFPILVIWMIVSVLKDVSVPVKELEKNEEWGYQDKEKRLLQTF